MEGKTNEKSEKTITMKESTLWKISTAVIGLLFVISLFTGGFGIGGNGGTNGNVVNNPPTPSPTPTPSAANVNAEDLADDDAFLGDANAPVTIVEFSDFQCPFCQRFKTDALGQIKSQYIDTGKVKFVYRDFPLTSIHPLAQPAAEAAECVRDAAGGSNEAYFKYHDKIFDNQASLSQASLISWAQEDGYDINACLNSGKFRSEVQADLKAATDAGGRGTPFFVVGSTPISGAQPFSAFQAAIEAELSK